MALANGVDRLPNSLIVTGTINEVANEVANAQIKEARADYDKKVDNDYLELTRQADNIIGLMGSAILNNKTMTISIPNEYRCWPFIGVVGDSLVCLYVKALDHEDPNRGAIYATLSKNGVIWTPSRCVIDTPDKRDGITGKGNGFDGSLLFLNRVGTPGGTRTYYETWKTYDGISFSKISTNAYSSLVGHAGDIIQVQGKLLSFYNTYGDTRTWGKLESSDGGITWIRTEIEMGLTKSECPTEISAVNVGNGRIFAIGRFDDSESTKPRLWQLQSSDNGVTWSRLATNIPSFGNTASLLYNSATDVLDMFVYRRQDGALQRWSVKLSDIWDNPKTWPTPTNIATGYGYGANAGNVNAVRYSVYSVAAFYSGNSTDTGIYCTICIE